MLFMFLGCNDMVAFLLTPVERQYSLDLGIFYFAGVIYCSILCFCLQGCCICILKIQSSLMASLWCQRFGWVFMFTYEALLAAGAISKAPEEDTFRYLSNHKHIGNIDSKLRLELK